MQQPTIAEIAAAAGVGKATASRALAGHPRVSAATRERVLAQAEAMGWRRSEDLDRLARRRWPDGRQPRQRRIAVLCGIDILPYAGDWPRAAARMGLDCELHYLRQAPADLGAQLEQRGVSGLVLLGLVDHVPLPVDLERFCCIFLGPYRMHLPYHRLLLDWRQLLRIALQQVRARGYRRPGFCLVHHQSDSYNELIADELAALRCRLPPLAELPVHWYNDADDTEAFSAWLREAQPDVVLSNFETHYWRLRELGQRMPEDLGYCCLICSPTQDSQLSGLRSWYRRQPDAILRFLHQELLQEHRGPPEYPWTILLPSTWQDGTTLREQ